jgi:anti-anti-sigma factor
MKQAWPTVLEVSVGEVDGYPCVRLSGEGERQGAQEVAHTFERLIGQGRTRLVLDTRDLRFLDPRCCAMLETVVQRLADEGGLLVVVDQSLPVERALKLLSLEQMVHVAPSVSQATTYLDWHE